MFRFLNQTTLPQRANFEPEGWNTVSIGDKKRPVSAEKQAFFKYSNTLLDYCSEFDLNKIVGRHQFADLVNTCGGLNVAKIRTMCAGDVLK